mmetsp:Transcript_45420/g.89322  ORF Transcript_45420/g.89322 Transcript_45420/m.89322 type:complete len:115 (-) Transcript_45420:60-404(-)
MQTACSKLKPFNTVVRYQWYNVGVSQGYVVTAQVVRTAASNVAQRSRTAGKQCSAVQKNSQLQGCTCANKTFPSILVLLKKNSTLFCTESLDLSQALLRKFKKCTEASAKSAFS